MMAKAGPVGPGETVIGAIGDVAAAVGKGVVAGVVGTLAMTAASALEAKRP